MRFSPKSMAMFQPKRPFTYSLQVSCLPDALNVSVLLPTHPPSMLSEFPICFLVNGPRKS
jgi:hypothetical protein